MAKRKKKRGKERWNKLYNAERRKSTGDGGR